ncbi:DNA (cytosine-5-)-methyltransferase [Caulobacter sp. 17J65-9]|uniref:DNA cytosine methyltransferase n=1 Tax=Caulobacter sp. 17J65-9 TaxID=2709382 RepID=UPI0013CCD35A|nr:DNA (cytosine-5-)-methyltransferase [Caulobacter sp. 17J65-9]NEX91635.1 DNA (cytosine-5-)-methyltransferase [Caulobacter sp. 17J65-9]
MKITGLFAGIGGLEHGLAQAGHETVAVSEIWDPACTVLRARVDAPNLGDVTDIKAIPAETELLTAGFPCQDLSQAGKTAGIEGRRSGLVGAVFDILDRQPVPWVLLENVSFMLRLERGAAMHRLVTEFEERGYRWAYRVINSLAFLPQRRERVFFLASREGDPSSVLFDGNESPLETPTSLAQLAHGFYWTEGIRGLGWAADAIPTLKNGSTIGIASPPAILRPTGELITPDIRDAERLQGLPEDWTKPAELTGRASWRWSLVGNAVSAPVAEWVGTRLLGTQGRTDFISAELPQSWPRAAYYDGSERRAALVSDFPVVRARAPLHDFLNYPGKPLSVRATAGFLERTGRSQLRFPAGFLDRVHRHLSAMQAAGLARAA